MPVPGKIFSVGEGLPHTLEDTSNILHARSTQWPPFIVSTKTFKLLHFLWGVGTGLPYVRTLNFQ